MDSAEDARPISELTRTNSPTKGRWPMAWGEGPKVGGPRSEQDYVDAAHHIEESRATWLRDLVAGQTLLAHTLAAAGHPPLSEDETSAVFGCHLVHAHPNVALGCRLKATEAIIAKMRRFGEPLKSMLDIFGFRIVVGTGGSLDAIEECIAAVWADPSAEQMLLRNGGLQFPPRRDYRSRVHAGLSPTSSQAYDDAIHVNRYAGFGMAEIQVMSIDLFRRIHCHGPSDVSHESYVAKRARLPPPSREEP